MKILSIGETNIKENLSLALVAEGATDISVKQTEILVSGLFISIVRFLQLSKSVEQPQALVFEDEKGNFKMAGIVRYIPSGGEAAGEFTVTISLDEEDIKNCNKTIMSDHTFQRIAMTEFCRIGCTSANAMFLFRTINM